MNTHRITMRALSLILAFTVFLASAPAISALQASQPATQVAPADDAEVLADDLSEQNRTASFDQGNIALRIRANIDGLSKLVFDGNYLYWENIDENCAAPGRHAGMDEPTYIYPHELADISEVKEWYPAWRNELGQVSTGEMRGYFTSDRAEFSDYDIYFSFRDYIPSEIFYSDVIPRGSVYIEPLPDGMLYPPEYSGSVIFDDIAYGGSAWYDITIIFTPKGLMGSASAVIENYTPSMNGTLLRLYDLEHGENWPSYHSFQVNSAGPYYVPNLDPQALYEFRLLTPFEEQYGGSEPFYPQDFGVADDMAVVADKQLLSASLTVNTPSGQVLGVNDYKTVWRDSDGKALPFDAGYCSNSQLLYRLAGSKAEYEILLLEEAALQYRLPSPETIDFAGQNLQITRTLEPLTNAELSGRLILAGTSTPVAGAQITVVQRNGSYTNTLLSESGDDGRFSASVHSRLPAEITVIKDGFRPAKITVDSVSDICDVADIALQGENGGYAVFTARMQPAFADGDEPPALVPYSLDQLDFELYNLTSSKLVSDIVYALGRMYMGGEDVSDGDTIRLNVTDRSEKAADWSGIFVYNTAIPAAVDIVLTENGYITGENLTRGSAVSKIAVTVFREDGRLFAFKTIRSDSFSLPAMPDGKYTVILSDDYLPIFGEIARLNQFLAAPLVEGSDYLRLDTDVSVGVVKQIHDLTVPAIDVDRYSFVQHTELSANKNKALVGTPVSVRAVYSLANTTAAYSMRFEIPEGCIVKPENVSVNGSASACSLQNGVLTVRLTERDGIVRFYLIPSGDSEVCVSAYTDVNFENKTVTYPAGALKINVEPMTFNLKSTTSSVTNSAYGTASPECGVSLYDNGKLVGHTVSQRNGSWSITFDLNEPSTNSAHEVYAIFSLSNDITTKSVSKRLIYNSAGVSATKITLITSSASAVADLSNRGGALPSYRYVTGDFTFIAEFTDATRVISADIVTRNFNGKYSRFPLSYDAARNYWTTAAHLSSYDAPVWVGVDFTGENDYILDSDLLQTRPDEPVDIGGAVSILPGLEYASADFWSEASSEDISHYLQSVSEYVDRCETIPEIDIEEIIQTIAPGAATEFSEGKTNVTFDGMRVEIETTSCDGLGADQLLADGYEKLGTSAPSSIYFKQTDVVTDVVDFDHDSRTTITAAQTDAPLSFAAHRMALTETSGASLFSQILSEAADALSRIGTLISSLTTADAAAVAKVISTQNVVHTLKYDSGKIYHAILDAKLDFANGKIDQLKLNEILNKLTPEKTRIDKLIIKYGKDLDKLLDLRATFSRLSKMANGLQGILAAVDAYRWWNLFSAVSNCDDPEAAALKTRTLLLGGKILAFYAGTTFINIYVVPTIVTVGGMAAIETAGVSVAAAVLILGGYIKLTSAAANALNAERQSILTALQQLDCNEDDEEEEDYWDDDWDDGFEFVPWIDPSGYVYEAVESNRLAGVTATAYYKPSLDSDLPQLWTAAEYQQNNPLTTDSEGMYAWDVPIGWWQVKYEKEGYQTAYSNWLPVPPPQLEVNVGMTRTDAPVVKHVNAYPEYIEIIFDRYMSADTLTTLHFILDNLDFSAQPAIESGTGGADLARIVRLIPDSVFFEGKVNLTISKNVKSYAQIPLGADYSCTTEVEERPISLECGDISVIQNAETRLAVSVSPSVGMAGKKVSVSSVSPLVTITPQADVGSDGKAIFLLTGILPGKAVLSFSLDGTLMAKNITVTVGKKQSLTEPIQANAPTVSHAAGFVEAGTQVTLSCDTPGAQIYYTIDGSCPYADGILYTHPIVITAAVRIRAHAEASGYSRSPRIDISYYTTHTEPALPEPTEPDTTETDSPEPSTAPGEAPTTPVEPHQPVERVPLGDISGHWAQEYIEWLYARHYLDAASGNLFKPEQLLTRAQAVQELYGVYCNNSITYQKSPFRDVKKDDPYTAAVNWAYGEGFVQGTTPTSFSPEANISREQFAVIIYRILAKQYGIKSLNEKKPFSDEKSVSSWALESVRTLQSLGIIAGRTTKYFAPADNITRAETAKIIYMLIQMYA